VQGRAILRQVGSIDLLDLDIISRFYGRDFLPFPFMLTRPSRFATQHELDDYARPVPDRFNHGDLRIFRRWAASYAYADVRVECHVQYIPAETPSVRVVGSRVGELGYIAKQRPDDDVIDVYELSPYALGRAVADSVVVTKPGSRSEIVIPEWGPRSENAYAAKDFSLHPVADTPSATEIRPAEVTAYGTVQSHWRPTRRWGFDRRKNAVVWVRIKDDGEYIYTTDFGKAVPMTLRTLTERTDRLIAEDVAVLREYRNS
jgi:hypothetical protein